MAISRVLIYSLLLLFVAALLVTPAARAEGEKEEEEASAVLTLDADNFTEVVAKHPFIVVEFYAPWCGHCKRLAPEYEKAASLLSKHDPPIVLAKVDANEGKNKELATNYEIQGFPTLKIIRNEGRSIQEYKGPREAEGIVEYLKKQVGPASAEIKTAEDAEKLIGDKKIFIVGVFPEYSGSEYENFMAVAEKLRSDYDFRHTLDATLLPQGDSASKGPLVRLFKPFDELVVDHKDFDVAALEKFIEVASMPLVVIFDKDPDNRPYLMKFFGATNTKVMFFTNFTTENFEAFKSEYFSAAENYKGKDINFLIGDLDASQGAFQYFGVKESQVPLLLAQENDGQKYLKPNLELGDIKSWLSDYSDGKLKPFRKSEPIPEVNNEPVKVVVADSIRDVVFNSGKNVLLEFYAPWCGHCKKLAPILEEVAVSLQNDDDVVIAKMDATANDVPKEFDVQGYPTMYFSSASGKLVTYDGGRTAEDIIDYIKKNKDTAIQSEIKETTESQSAEDEPAKDESVKDEL